MSASIRRAQPWLGTFVDISATGAAACDIEKAVEAAFAAIAQVHRLMSFHEAASDLSRINRQAFAETVTVHPWTYRVLEAALALHRRSAGLFDITVAPLLQRRGMLPGKASDFDAKREWMGAADSVALLGDCRVRCRDPGVRIDLGGIAKGFAVDRALEILRRFGVRGALVNAGGDLAGFGSEAETVHVRDPKDPSRILCSIGMADAALASSGRILDAGHPAQGARSAIFDPTTQRPARGVAGATVRAPTCMIADALTKVVMIAGQAATALLKQCRADALLVLESGDVWITPGWRHAICPAA